MKRASGSSRSSAVDDRVAAVAQRVLHGRDRAVHAPGAGELVHDRLGDHVRRDVGVGRDALDLLDQRGGPDEVADADARADRLGERGRVDDLARVVLREHRRQRLALEADRDVRVVLEDREVVLGREPQQLGALLRAQRVAGRVLEVGDDVRELGLHAAGEQRAQRGRVDPVRLQLDHVQVGAAVAQVEQRAVVGRRLDDDRVARADEQLEEERVGLHRAVGDQHLLHARRRAARRSTRAAARSRPTCRTRSSRRDRSRRPAARPRAAPPRRRCRATARPGRTRSCRAWPRR